MSQLWKRCVRSVLFCGTSAHSICWALLMALGMIGTLTLGAVAQAQIVLPDVGVDVAGHVTEVGADTGVIVLAVLGVFAAFLVVRFGWQWLRRAK